jgi:hypothetical protein
VRYRNRNKKGNLKMKTKKIKILRGIAFSLSVLAMSPNTCNAENGDLGVDTSGIGIAHHGSKYVPDGDGFSPVDQTSEVTISGNGMNTPLNIADIGGSFTPYVNATMINPNADMKAVSSSGNNAISGTTNINNVATVFDAQALNKSLGVTTINSSSSTDMGNMSSNNVDLSQEANLTDVGSNTVDYSTTNDHESGGSVGGSISTNVDTSLESKVHAL